MINLTSIHLSVIYFHCQCHPLVTLNTLNWSNMSTQSALTSLYLMNVNLLAALVVRVIFDDDDDVVVLHGAGSRFRFVLLWLLLFSVFSQWQPFEWCRVYRASVNHRNCPCHMCKNKRQLIMRSKLGDQ